MEDADKDFQPCSVYILSKIVLIALNDLITILNSIKSKFLRNLAEIVHSKDIHVKDERRYLKQNRFGNRIELNSNNRRLLFNSISQADKYLNINQLTLYHV